MRKGRACEAHGGKCQVADDARPWLRFEFYQVNNDTICSVLYPLESLL